MSLRIADPLSTMRDTTDLTGKQAPAFNAPVIGGSYGEGATVSLADLKGQTVVLYFSIGFPLRVVRVVVAPATLR